MIKYSDNFLKEAKKLLKKYKLLKSDLKKTVEEIESGESLGVYLGYELYKKRVANSSIPTGKSGGFRIIIYQKIVDETVLISIYSKTQKDTLTDEELIAILKQYMDN